MAEPIAPACLASGGAAAPENARSSRKPSRWRERRRRRSPYGPSSVGAIIVSGVPGAGKTTIARLLAARFDRAAHLEGDLVSFGFIVSGLVPPQGPPKDEAERQLELRRRNVCLLADSFADAGFIPVIDDVVVSPSVLDLYLILLRTRPLRLVQLTPTLDVIQRRDSGRDKHVFDLWHHLNDQLHNQMPRVGLWLDTSDLTEEQTVDAVFQQLDQARVRQ
jgi:gluconate kinase